MLFRLQAQDFEFVFVAGGEHGRHTRTARRLFLVAVAFRTALFDFRDVAKRLDAFGQFDERAEVCGARHFALQHVAQLCAR